MYKIYNEMKMCFLIDFAQEDAKFDDAQTVSRFTATQIPSS